MDVTVGVDIGTTSVKAVAVTPSGEVVASTRIPHDALPNSFGSIGHDAVLAWREGPRSAAVEVAREAVAAGHRVVGVGVAAMTPSMCAVGADGVPISPGMIYGDRRAALGENSTDASAQEDAGLPGEYERMVAHMAGAYPDAVGYWPAQAVAVHALCGQAAVDEIASMVALPLFNGQQWDQDRLTAAGVNVAQMPAVVPLGQFAGTCSGVDPALEGAGVVGGTLDAFCEQIVSGVKSTGDVLVILGATLITWAIVEGWPEVPGLWTVPHTDPGMSMVGGPSNAGGIFRDWATRSLRAPAEFEEPPFGGSPSDGPLTDELVPDDVPVWLPYIRGERVPHHDAGRVAMADGLRVTQGPASLWRGVHEATGFAVRHILDLAGVKEQTHRVVLAGGGSSVSGWVQAIADATGIDIHPSAAPNGGALGAAFTARMAAEPGVEFALAAHWAKLGEVVRPDPLWVDATDRRYRRFRWLADVQADAKSQP